ncbi:CPBP family intramembrane glutamic endopeptidase [Bacillus salacetis]|nr:CPBP family intramembrane glutamic endopeptidase [Bacillus salacetis]
MKNSGTKTFLLKTLQLMGLYLLAFLLESVIIPQLTFIQDSLPEFTGRHKVQNRIIVILFLLTLLLTIGKKYYYLFSTEPLKAKESYVWTSATIIAIYIIMQSTGFITIAEIRLFPLDPGDYLQLLFIVVILVPIQEEFLYRGLLLLVPDHKVKYLMLIVSSILFALLHHDPFAFFWMGMGYGILAIRFKNIWVPILAHALWNLAVSFIEF